MRTKTAFFIKRWDKILSNLDKQGIHKYRTTFYYLSTEIILLSITFMKDYFRCFYTESASSRVGRSARSYFFVFLTRRIQRNLNKHQIIRTSFISWAFRLAFLIKSPLFSGRKLLCSGCWLSFSQSRRKTVAMETIVFMRSSPKLLSFLRFKISLLLNFS